MILAASKCTFSNFSSSCFEQPSKTSHAYSKSGKMNVLFYDQNACSKLAYFELGRLPCHIFRKNKSIEILART